MLIVLAIISLAVLIEAPSVAILVQAKLNLSVMSFILSAALSIALPASSTLLPESSILEAASLIFFDAVVIELLNSLIFPISEIPLVSTSSLVFFILSAAESIDLPASVIFFDDESIDSLAICALSPTSFIEPVTSLIKLVELFIASVSFVNAPEFATLAIVFMPLLGAFGLLLIEAFALAVDTLTVISDSCLLTYSNPEVSKLIFMLAAWSASAFSSSLIESVAVLISLSNPLINVFPALLPSLVRSMFIDFLTFLDVSLAIFLSSSIDFLNPESSALTLKSTSSLFVAMPILLSYYYRCRY